MIEECCSDPVIVFTDADAKLALDEAGFDQSSTHALLIGQHHLTFSIVQQDPLLKERILRAFATVNAFTALSKQDAEDFDKLLGISCFSVPNVSASVSLSEPDGVVRTRNAVALARLSDEKQLDWWNCAASARLLTAAPETSWPTSTTPAHPTARPKRSTAPAMASRNYSRFSSGTRTALFDLLSPIH